jgi:hypothetical protein
MELLSSISNNLLSPGVLFFTLGIIAGLVKSDLNVPDSISRYLSLYLMMAIGFKGGVAIAATEEFTSQIMLVIFAGFMVSLLLPFVAYSLLRLTTRIDSPTAAAVAGHYGSISMVTFVTGMAFLKEHDIAFAGYIVGVLALMEAPAIVSALFIAHRAAPETRTHAQEEKKLSREIFTNGSILLIFGALIIGIITGDSGMEKMEGFLVTPFQGVLALFLLDMGLLVSKNFHELRNFTWSLAAFGIYMPVIGGAIGLAISSLLGVDVGTGTLFMILCASASYIAVPAAMRLALPEAKAGVYVPLSLAITFPFNVIVGIPVYHTLAEMFLAQG